MEERELTFVKRIRQLAEEGQMIEIELRGKEDSRQVGKVVFVGDDYIEFVREVKSETPQEGDDTIITIFNLTTIMLLADLQAYTILQEGATVRQVPTAGKKNG